jgi:hypothetical protein
VVDVRKAIGVLSGILAAAAVFWFVPDIIRLVGGCFHDRTAITTAALMVLMSFAGLQVGALVRWGTQKRGCQLAGVANVGDHRPRGDGAFRLCSLPQLIVR